MSIVQDIAASRVVVNGSSLTIHNVTASDHLKGIQCEVTDEQNMKGFGQYLILINYKEHDDGKVSSIPFPQTTRS